MDVEENDRNKLIKTKTNKSVLDEVNERKTIMYKIIKRKLEVIRHNEFTPLSWKRK